MPINLFDPSDFGFPEGSAIFDYPPDARKAINEATMRTRGSESYVRFWNRVLSVAEREQLGNDLEVCFKQDPSCINLLCRLRDWIAERATIEIVYRLGFLTGADYQWLRNVVGDPISEETVAPLAPTLSTPSWDRSSGRLEFEGQLCREIRVARATAIVPILDAFQVGNWPPTIPYLNESHDGQRIHQIVRNLNMGLVGIRFGVRDQDICWSPSTS